MPMNFKRKWDFDQGNKDLLLNDLRNDREVIEILDERMAEIVVPAVAAEVDTVLDAELDPRVAADIEDPASDTAIALLGTFVNPLGRSLKKPRASLFLFFGESNSGGLGLNSDLSAAELLARPLVQILDNTTPANGFDSLDIGTNNLLGHTGLTGVSDGAGSTYELTRHGWESDLANSAERGEWGSSAVYLVKTGAGGSVLSQWNTGGAYFTTLTTRITSAVNALKAAGYEVDVFGMCSIGINDHIATLTANDYKTALLDYIARVRAIVAGLTGVPSMPITFTLLPADRATYNVKLYEIAAADPLFFLIDTATAPLQVDGNHWTSGGMKIIGERMLTAHRTRIGRGTQYDTNVAAGYSGTAAVQVRADEINRATTRAPVVWSLPSTGVTDAGSGVLSGSGSANVGALLSTALDAATLDVVIDYSTSAATNGVVVLVDDEPGANYTWSSGNAFLSCIYHVAGALYSGGTTGANAVSISQTIPGFPGKIRMRARGVDVIYSRSLDDGQTWREFYTHAGALTGKATVYIKAIFATAAASQAIKVSVTRLASEVSRDLAVLTSRLSALEAALYRDVAWTSLSGGVLSDGAGTISKAGSGSAIGGIATTALNADDFEVIGTMTSLNASSGVVLLLESTADTTYTWSGAQTFVAGIYQTASNVYRATDGGGSVTDTTVDATYPCQIRLRNSGDDVIADLSRDGGSTWVSLYTFTAALSGLTEVYPKVIFATGTTNQSMRVKVRR